MKERHSSLTAICASSLFACGVVLAGCNNTGDDGLSKSDKQMIDQTAQIIQKAHGDWNALSDADKKYLIDKIGYGNEHNAQMYFMAQSGGLKYKGPPTGPGPHPASGQ